MLLTLEQLLSRIRDYLMGRSEFSDVRRFVYEYYEAESDLELEPKLENVLSVFLSYVQYEEAEGDASRHSRVRRFFELVTVGQSCLVERTVFALEFDEIRRLTEKHDSGVISTETYYNQMRKLSPADYDGDQLIRWACAHRNLKEPVGEYCVDIDTV